MSITAREISFILPLYTPDGEHKLALHLELQKELVKLAGGFTAHPVMGAWKDGDQLVTDNSLRYIVAVNMVEASIYYAVKDLFMGYAKQLNQKALYWVDDQGEVNLVTVP